MPNFALLQTENTLMNHSQTLTRNSILLLAIFIFGSSVANAGPVIIDGTDANEHGSNSGAANLNGWLYMQKVLENLAGNMPSSNTKVLVDLGSTAGAARTSINSAFNFSSLPAAGWTIVHIDGAANITAWLNSVSASNTGILYIPTYGLTSGDLDSTEIAAINSAAAQIAGFVNAQGGGLFAMGELGTGAWGWLTTLIPGLVPIALYSETDITLTSIGGSTFPGLSNVDLASADPWHNYFTGNLGSLSVLATAPDTSGAIRTLIIGGGIGTVFTNSLSLPSDQKTGSFLVFPYYYSKSSSDTRLTISNTGDKSVAAHLFFLDASCNQADQFICLTPNASQSFLASEYDPENTGYLLAVAVSDGSANFPGVAAGCPVQYNGLIGNAFVNDGSYVGNYGAEAFWGHTQAGLATCDLTNWTAQLNLNGKCDVGGYDQLPTQHVAEIQSPNDATGQKIITVGLRGTIGGTIGGTISGAEQVGVGIAYNDGEKPGSYSNPFGDGCQKNFTIDARTPRVPGGLGSQAGSNNKPLIPAGRSGTLKWNTMGSVGLILTPKTGTNKWSGIRTLHKSAVTNATLTIPILKPNC
jgi:hypothetical protein